MELWLDTIDFDLIIKATKQLNITGITTNPTILANSSLSALDTIYKLLEIQPGNVAVQVTENTHSEMIKQAKAVASIDKRIIIKVPVNYEGLYTIKELSTAGVSTMATAIFEVSQVLLSAMAGSAYAAPYFGKIKGDNLAILQNMLDIININNHPLKIIAAAVRCKEQVLNIAKIGTHAITIPSSTFLEFIGDLSDTTESLNKFNHDWISSGKVL